MKKHTACLRLIDGSWVKIQGSDIEMQVLGSFYRALGVSCICIPEALKDYSRFSDEDVAKVPFFEIEPDHNGIREMLEEEERDNQDEDDEDSDEFPADDEPETSRFYEERLPNGKKVMRRC